MNAAFIGVVICHTGFILLAGNIFGWWGNLFYAGFIAMATGGLITRALCSNSKNAR